MVDITIFELHLDGSEFTANAPGVGGSDDAEADESDSGGAPLGLFAVLALVGLVVAAVAAKKLGGDDEGTGIEVGGDDETTGIEAEA
ncbi:hypothetical protein [Haloarcula salinisoli]|uniref:Uncharacterized protein n=1 Tax=Haloarcula salinisoli TaxID=2487746 RepID=A0A8J7YI18_9EURY|nr:hypothetical protein [Halomicroarcula salinisoli]MBX0285109.1 hypothetical protein [Halomicroarcula salinisoli]MBX0303414.1 hypothetical protein [Halomicroarcula salinisoli]